MYLSAAVLGDCTARPGACSWTGPTTHYSNDTCASIRINILMDMSKSYENTLSRCVGRAPRPRERASERERKVDRPEINGDCNGDGFALSLSLTPRSSLSLSL